MPGAAPARGAVAPLAAERSRPTAPAMMWLPHYLACHAVGASTGALPLAVVDAIPGDLEGPRGGANGCAKFLSLVCLSPCELLTDGVAFLPAVNYDTARQS